MKNLGARYNGVRYEGWTIRKKGETATHLLNSYLPAGYDHVAHLDFYKKVKADRKKYSKYDPAAEMVSVTVRNDVRLNKKFFENIEEISKAQTVYDSFGNFLYK